MHTCNSENAKVNEGITGASQSSSRAALKGVSSTATIRPVMMHLLIIIVAQWTYYMHAGLHLENLPRGGGAKIGFKNLGGGGGGDAFSNFNTQ